VAATEIAVWTPRNEPPLQGTVLHRGGPTAKVLVRWETGREEKISPKDSRVQFAPADSRRLEWLLTPKKLRAEFEADPSAVFTAVIREEGKNIQTAVIKRRLTELGLDSATVAKAFDAAKPALKANRHIVIKGATHSWSDVPVDPFADLRGLPPHEALDRLITTPRLTLEKKQALADAVRAGLQQRG
jgi:hypothetical protein